MQWQKRFSYFGMQQKRFMYTSHFLTQNINKNALKGRDSRKLIFTVLSRTLKLIFFYFECLKEHNGY